MTNQISSGSGIQYPLLVNEDGSINISSDITISGVTIDAVSIKELPPTNSFYNNAYTELVYIASGTSTGVTGSSIGSIIKYIDTGSYVKVLSYLNDNLVNIGSWS
jgi:hypothetical protein